jgi:hypothetical protein
VQGTITTKYANEHTGWYKWFGWLFGKDRTEVKKVNKIVEVYPKMEAITKLGTGLNLNAQTVEGGVEVGLYFTEASGPVAGRFVPVNGPSIPVRKSFKGISADLMVSAELRQ